jgi:hypothetical protein
MMIDTDYEDFWSWWEEWVITARRKRGINTDRIIAGEPSGD